jgi:hypothetical protein
MDDAAFPPSLLSVLLLFLLSLSPARTAREGEIDPYAFLPFLSPNPILLLLGFRLLFCSRAAIWSRSSE